MTTIRLAAAQAMVHYLAAQRTVNSNTLAAGCWAIFGQSDVAGLGEALHELRAHFPTSRGQNE